MAAFSIETCPQKNGHFNENSQHTHQILGFIVEDVGEQAGEAVRGDDCKIHHLNTKSLGFDTHSLVFDTKFFVFNAKFINFTHSQLRHRWRL